MNELKMYRCEICGNLICMVEDSGVVPECCGTEMTLVEPNTVEATVEKHVPVIKRDGVSVMILVGALPHPMTPQHYISIVFLLTNKGVYMRYLEPDDEPKAMFTIGRDEDVNSAYAWCTVHGLWMS